MRAWMLKEFGALEHLVLETLPKPEPGPGEALVRVEYAALNPADRFMIHGQYPKPAPLPFAVGRDMCGIIEQPARGGNFHERDRVLLLRSDLGVSRTGTLAEYVAAPEESLALLPEGWSPEEGAAGPLVHLTAWQALAGQGGISQGDTVLITGASGGVGTAALVQAKAMGARVVALSRSPEKRARLREMGADIVADAGGDWEREVKSALDGGRAQLAIENLGGPFLQQCINLLAYGGRVAVVGLLSGLTSEIVVGLLIHKRLRIEGINVSAYTAAESQQAWQHIVETLRIVDALPLVDRVYPLEQVHEAFEYLASGPMGKVVIKM